MIKLFKLILILSFVCTKLYGQQTSPNIHNNEKWDCEITFENRIGPFKTFLFFNFDDSGNFIANSTKNADKRIFGCSKAIIARLFNKSPKKGVLLKITNGKIFETDKNDSLFGNIHIPMIGKFNLVAIKSNDSIYGNIFDSIELIGNIKGTRLYLNTKIEYENLIERIIDTTETYIYDPHLLKTKQWRKFIRKLNNLSSNAIDDIEFFLGFNILSQKLPFSHYNLFLFSGEPNIKEKNNEDHIYFEEKSKNTAYIEIQSFGGSSKEMDSIFNIIFANNYDNLIIDLRKNSGGGLNSAIPFGRYLSQKEINAGVFLTNKWYQDHNVERDTLIFCNIPVTLATNTTALINELKYSEGKQLVITPGEKTYNGNVYILTSNKTGSTCEPIVYALKKNKIATIIGERTAGAMLSAAFFNIIGKYYIFLPIADYYTSDGKRLDQIGVEPDINIKSEEALEYVINNLIKLNDR